MNGTEREEEQERSRMPVAFAAGVVVMVVLLGAFELLTHVAGGRSPAVQQHLPFGPAEQKAAEHIHFESLRLSQATNFLNQEFTFVSGVLSNDGVGTLGDVEVTLEFRDPFNEVVLRESRRTFAPNSPPLFGGEKRAFEIMLDSVPATWNKQSPSIRITGLVLK